MKTSVNILLKLIIGYILFLGITRLAGCKAIEKAIEQRKETKATTFFDRHPDKAAEYCAEHFPVKDSAGLPVLDSTRKAKNENHAQLIDSINNAVAQLQDSLNGYWVSVLDSSTSEIGAQFSAKILKYKIDIASLKEAIKKLHASYKPCQADTVFYTKTNFTVDGAALAAANLKYQKEYEARAAAEKKLSSTSNQNKVRFWMLMSSGLLNVLLGVLLFKIKKFKLPWT